MTSTFADTAASSTNPVAVTPPQVALRVADLVAPSAFGSVLGPAPADIIALTGGSPALEALPAAELAAATAAVLADPRRFGAALDYSSHAGHLGLRTWIAEREGVHADRVVITNGALHALSLTFLAAIDPGDVVVVENPVYPLALKVLQLPAAQLAPIPVDQDGLQVDVLEQQLRAGLRPRALYVVPDFHNPTGRVLSADRRIRLVELAERYGFLLVSDNPYAELHFGDAVVPDLDLRSDRVVHANTFSKTLGPGLRLGWVVLPTWLVRGVLDLRSRLDQHAGSLIQETVVELLSDPARFPALTSYARQLYSRRAEVLVHSLQDAFGDNIEVERPAGGVFGWPRFTGDVDLDQLALASRARGVGVIPGGQFAAAAGTDADHRLRVSFAQNDADRIRRGVDRLAAAYADLTATR